MRYRIQHLLSLLAIAAWTRCAIPADEVVAYRGATIETVAAAGVIADGTIVIRNGLIDAVGPAAEVKIPVNARVIDAKGRTVMPALIDAYHPINLGGAAAQTETRTIVIGGRTFTIPSAAASTAAPFLRIADDLDPLSLKNGLTTQSRYGVGHVNVVTRGYGQAVQARVTPENAETCVVEKDGVLFLALTNDSTSLDVLRNGLRGRPSSSTRSSGGPTGGRGGPTQPTSPPAASTTPAAPASSSLTALWEAVKEGKTPILLNVNNAATILYLLQIQKDYDKLRVVMVADGRDVYQALDQLKGRDVSILLRAGLDLAPHSRDRINVPRLLAANGIRFGFSTSLDSTLAAMPDTPLFPVAMLVSTGLPRDKALQALTLAPATMLGLDKSLGSIENGKRANLIFLDGDPLSASSQIRQVLVEGKSVYEN